MTDRTRDDTADVVALGRLSATYADTVTRRAWAELADLFLAEATIEVDTVTAPPHRFVGAVELAAFIGPALDRFDHFQFVVLNMVFEVTGRDVARGRIYMSEVRREAASREWSTTYGIYQDLYRRVEGDWLFADRRYRSLARTGPNAGAFGSPPGLEPFGR